MGAPIRAGHRRDPGLVDVDPETLRSGGTRRSGRSATWPGYPDSSGGGLRKQVDVLARNLAAARDGGTLTQYDGYTVVPITSRRRLMLVEVDRESRPSPPSR